MLEYFNKMDEAEIKEGLNVVIEEFGEGCSQKGRRLFLKRLEKKPIFDIIDLRVNKAILFRRLAMIRSVAFVGIGAVGAIYAQRAARYTQVPCAAIVQDASSYRNNPVFVNDERLDMPLLTATDSHAPFDLMIVAVKWHAFEAMMEQMALFVGRGTVILSLLNGIQSEKRLMERFPEAHVIPALCSGVDSNRSGRKVHMNRIGEIVFGELDGRTSDAVRDAEKYFRAVQIPCCVSNEIERALWWKLMVNVGMNQVSSVMNLTYGEFRQNDEAMARMHRAQCEVIAVAQASGVPMTKADIARWDRQLASLSPGGFSSTLQDIRARRKTEVELYGEEICRLGRELGVPTPENQALAEEIRRIELTYLP